MINSGDDSDVIAILGRKGERTYGFDGVFGPYATQAEVFEQVARPIVDEVASRDAAGESGRAELLAN